MSTERLTGAPLPSDGDDPNNFGGLMQATLEQIAEFTVPSFADAGERDAVWVDPGPHNGAKCWLDSPAGFYSKWPGGWRPDAVPRDGETTTVQKSIVSDSDVNFTTPSDTDFGCSTTLEVPGWATEFGGQAQVSCVLHTPLDAAGDGSAGNFSLYMQYSTDGGSTWQRGSSSGYRGADITAAILLTATDDPDTIDCEGVSNLRLKIIIASRTSSGGTLRRVTQFTKAAWVATFTPAA